MLSPRFENLRNILAIRLDNIGDVLMLGPSLRALRQAYPDARITLMASPAGTQAAGLLPWVDQVITWRAVWQDIAKDVPVDIEKEHNLVRLLAEQQFDAAFIFTSFSQSPYPPAYACYLAGIPVRVGQSREFGGGLLTDWIKPPENTGYQVERNLHLLRSVGIPVESMALELNISVDDQRSTDGLLASLGFAPREDFIVLAPGASAKARRYPEARFAEAAHQLAVETGLPVVLIGSQREVGRFPSLEGLAGGAILPENGNGAAARIYSLIGKTTLAETAALIQRSALVIANNSGPLHMAVACQRPMLILYSGTDALEQWSPPDDVAAAPARFLYRTTHCTPCYNFECPYQLECLDIPAHEVVAAALELLQAEAPHSQMRMAPQMDPSRR